MRSIGEIAACAGANSIRAQLKVAQVFWTLCRRHLLIHIPFKYDRSLSQGCVDAARRVSHRNRPRYSSLCSDIGVVHQALSQVDIAFGLAHQIRCQGVPETMWRHARLEFIHELAVHPLYLISVHGFGAFSTFRRRDPARVCVIWLKLVSKKKAGDLYGPFA